MKKTLFILSLIASLILAQGNGTARAEGATPLARNMEKTKNTVQIRYNGTKADIAIPRHLLPYLRTEISGAHVKLRQGKEVSENTCGEITYVLSGTSAEGSFSLEGSYKASVELNSLTLTNPAGAAIDIQNGKRIRLSTRDKTMNILTDSHAGTQKGCLSCSGHLKLEGKGSMRIHAHAAHGIYAKEYIEMESGTVDIRSAAKDGVNCRQYFHLKGGTLHLSGTGDDGLQVSYKDDTDRKAEDTGSVTISGGILTTGITAQAAKGIKAEGNITIENGNVEISASGAGKWNPDKQKTQAAACLSADSAVRIYGGNIRLTATGSGGKGISCHADLLIRGGNTEICTKGGTFAYINGTEYPDYTGFTDHLEGHCKSSPKGIKADGNVCIEKGNIRVTTTGTGGEGIESKAVMTVSGGTIMVNAYDDGLNSSGHMYLKGGDITVLASHNDGIDSNGNLYISGGNIRAFGGNMPEGGIDANEEEGYSVFFTGGTLLAVGGRNSVPVSAENSTQAFISASDSVSAGSTITLKDGSKALLTFAVPDEYTPSSGFPPGPHMMPGAPGEMLPPPGKMPDMPGKRPEHPGRMQPFGAGGPPHDMKGNGILVSSPKLIAGNSYTIHAGTSSTTVSAIMKEDTDRRPMPW